MGKCVLGILIMIAGAFSFGLGIPFPMNLVVAVTTMIIGAATASLWECGHCRGHVDRDAVECPRCTTRFSVP